MNNIFDDLKSLLDKENGRRKLAINWVKKFELELAKIDFESIFESIDSVHCTIRLNEDFYIRYKDHYGKENLETKGIYYKEDNYGMRLWGISLCEIKGRLFWRGLKAIITNIEGILKNIKDIDNGRDDILSLINIKNNI